MSIQLEISEVNERSRNMEIGLVLIAAAMACSFIFTADFYFALAVLVAYVPLSIWLANRLRAWRYARILELYRYQFEPIFEVQRGANDPFNFERAEFHREMLIRSGNEIYARCLITVEEIYDRDPRFGYAETPEEQAIRRADYMREFLNNWALALTKDNALFVKQWLNKQAMGDAATVEIAEATPSVSEAKTGDFWQSQFPMFTRLVRGKEVETI